MTRPGHRRSCLCKTLGKTTWCDWPQQPDHVLPCYLSRYCSINHSNSTFAFSFGVASSILSISDQSSQKN